MDTADTPVTDTSRTPLAELARRYRQQPPASLRNVLPADSGARVATAAFTSAI